MKARAWALFFTVAVAATSARAQGTFQNLDFEAARVDSGLLSNWAVNLLAASDAWPEWSASYNTFQLSTINEFNSLSYAQGSRPPVALIFSAPQSLDGAFSVFLSSGGGPVVAGRGTIGQTGLVPAGVHSLQFKAVMGPDSSLQVSLGGKSLSYFALSTTPNYTVYGADISAFAGETATLSFLEAERGGWSEIDDIQFSPQIVPEPGGAALFLLGLGMLTSVRRRGGSPPRRAGPGTGKRCIFMRGATIRVPWTSLR